MTGAAELSEGQKALRRSKGMRPMRYLWRRRMRLARQALRDRRRPEATVTAIAMEFGFWDLGHFAVSYRRPFGQTPRQTLASH